jgi:phosphate:Na+ symporter
MTPILEFVAGLGLFLYAMRLLEQALKLTAEFRLHKHLAQNTDSPIQAIVTGTVSTAMLQSSSLVGLIVLALCGAGILPLINAIGVMIGANLGTTFTGWLVTFIGFKLDLTAFAFYFVGFAGLLRILVNNSRLQRIAEVIIAIGLLLLGLDLMKNAASGVSDLVDISSFKEQSILYFFILGIVLSAIIQSSSAVMMITLSALNINVIELQGAAALVIGADLGTTSTVLLGSLKGTAIKRQLAMAHLLFNLVTDLIALVLLLPFITTLIGLLGLEDPLYSLVAFHSFFNFVGIILFVPILKPFANWLSGRFQTDQAHLATIIHDVPAEVPGIALAALKKEVTQLLLRSLKANQEPLHDHVDEREATYQELKTIEGEIVSFNKSLQRCTLSETEIDMLTSLNYAVRLSIFSFKSLNDIQHDIQPLYLAHKDEPEMKLTEDMFQQLIKTSTALEQLLLEPGPPGQDKLAKEFETLKVDLKVTWINNQQALYRTDIDKKLTYVQISSLLNLNREIYNAANYAIESAERLVSIADVLDTKTL